MTTNKIYTFETDRCYRNINYCGEYVYIDDLYIHAFTEDSNTFIGTIYSRVERDGTSFGHTSRDVVSKVRKVTNKDYQQTTDLPMTFYSNIFLMPAGKDKRKKGD